MMNKEQLKCVFDKEFLRAIQDAVDWAMFNNVKLKDSPHSSRHAPLSFTPVFIDEQKFHELVSASPLLGKLLHTISENHDFLSKAIEPVTSGDLFFKMLLDAHNLLYSQGNMPLRTPLLIMRTDFMDDAKFGPQLIEFNGIAAGMGPFGQKAHELHSYLYQHWPQVFKQWSCDTDIKLIENPAISRLAMGIAEASLKIRQESGDSGQANFLMIVQENEDNIYDQYLLEDQLRKLGIQTYRRTPRELYGTLLTGEKDRLLLSGVGPIDVVYLRTGYQYSDYVAGDIDGPQHCETLMQTRIFIEKHKVAVNATINQQLATSKRIQLLLSLMSTDELMKFNLTSREAKIVQKFFGDMRPVDNSSYDFIKFQPHDAWVLKNQGEGGGHCIFNQDILPALAAMKPDEYSAWALMRRVHPEPRNKPALVIRNKEPSVIDDLISEIGIFTVHLDGKPAVPEQGYAGYLIRSKSSSSTEGGIHSGMGVLDSLACVSGACPTEV